MKISIKELEEQAKNSSLKKGMIVRALPMSGSWAGLEGAEFYVLSGECEPMWGHQMAIRHIFDVDPETSLMLGTAIDKEENTLFHYVSLTESCVEILDQETWTETRDTVYRQEAAWKEYAEYTNIKDREAYENWKARYEETGNPEHKQWMDAFSRCLIEDPWKGFFERYRGQMFKPEMINEWVKDPYEQ